VTERRPTTDRNTKKCVEIGEIAFNTARAMWANAIAFEQRDVAKSGISTP